MKTKLFNVFILAIFIALASFPKPAIPYPADIKDIHGRDYYSTLHEELQNAKESIVVLMYFINFDPAKRTKCGHWLTTLLKPGKEALKLLLFSTEIYSSINNGCRVKVSMSRKRIKRF